MMLNANNRSDGSALVIAQRQMEALRALPLSAKTFTDPLGVTCPMGTTCYTGDPSNPGQVVGSALFNNTPIIDYAQPLVTGYGFTYTDPTIRPARSTMFAGRWSPSTTAPPPASASSSGLSAGA